MKSNTVIAAKNILLITYTFPPYPGIAGRRWAKFAKYLIRNGLRVHVICSKNPFEEDSLWINDVKDNPDIILHSLSPLYPKVLLTNPGTFLQKTKYSFWNVFLPMISKGTIYDRALFWKRQLLAKSNELVKKYNIENVVVSGAPFNLNYFATMLKKEFPSLNLISDLRDPWTWGHGYGYPSLSPLRKAFEQQKEAQVIEKSDYISVPVQAMKEHLVKKYPLHQKKIFLLPHAFDKEEISVKQHCSDYPIRIVFYGNLYDGIEEYFIVLSNTIMRLGNKVRLEIYSDSDRYSYIFAQQGLLNANVFYYKSLPAKQLFERIKSSNFVLLVHPTYGVDNVSTKFYEVIYSRTPILYLSKPGFTSKFIETHKIGYFIPLDEVETKIEQIILGNPPYTYNANFNVDDFSFDALSNSLISNYLS